MVANTPSNYLGVEYYYDNTITISSIKKGRTKKEEEKEGEGGVNISRRVTSVYFYHLPTKALLSRPTPRGLLSYLSFYFFLFCSLDSITWRGPFPPLHALLVPTTRFFLSAFIHYPLDRYFLIRFRRISLSSA